MSIECSILIMQFGFYSVNLGYNIDYSCILLSISQIIYSTRYAVFLPFSFYSISDSLVAILYYLATPFGYRIRLKFIYW